MKKLIVALFCMVSMSVYAKQKSEMIEHLVVKKEVLNSLKSVERNFVADTLSNGIWEYNKNPDDEKLSTIMTKINTNISHPLNLCIFGNNVMVVTSHKTKCSEKLNTGKDKLFRINTDSDI